MLATKGYMVDDLFYFLVVAKMPGCNFLLLFMLRLAWWRKRFIWGHSKCFEWLFTLQDQTFVLKPVKQIIWRHYFPNPKCVWTSWLTENNLFRARGSLNYQSYSRKFEQFLVSKDTIFTLLCVATTNFMSPLPRVSSSHCISVRFCLNICICIGEV